MSTTRLQQQYKKEILPRLQDELDFENELAVPRIEKIVINAGVGKLLQEQPKALDQVVDDVTQIAGQRAVVTRAKKAVSAFKIRRGQPVGVTVTLREEKMYDFLDKLINVALPRVRDFRGYSKNGFDKQGNYSLGIKDHSVFPEMAALDPELSFGLEVTIVTSTEDDQETYKLLKAMGFPFRD